MTKAILLRGLLGVEGELNIVRYELRSINKGEYTVSSKTVRPGGPA